MEIYDASDLGDDWHIVVPGKGSVNQFYSLKDAEKFVTQHSDGQLCGHPECDWCWGDKEYICCDINCLVCFPEGELK